MQIPHRRGQHPRIAGGLAFPTIILRMIPPQGFDELTRLLYSIYADVAKACP
jgi:hypothetical protein